MVRRQVFGKPRPKALFTLTKFVALIKRTLILTDTVKITIIIIKLKSQ